MTSAEAPVPADDDVTDESAPKVRQVEDLLLELRDDSAIMVDLAYSALLYDSRAIAEEVVAMEEEADRDFDTILRLALQAVQDGDLSTGHAQIIIQVAQAAETIADSALEIADVVLRDVEPHPVIAATIRQSDSVISKVVLAADSDFAGERLRDLELESGWGMRIVAVKRKGRWRTAVDGAFRLQADDLLIASGPLDGEADFLAAATAGSTVDAT